MNWIWHQCHLHILFDHVVKNVIHHPLVRGPCVLNAEWHGLVIKVAQVVRESRLLSFSWVHLDLIVSRVCIEETKDIVVYCTINYSVNGWQMIGIFGTRFIKVGVFHTHLPFATRFLNHDYVSQLCSVVCCFNKAGFNQFLCFLSSDFASFLP